MDPIALSLFVSRLSATCDDMGAVLQRAALSPNIKDRLDFSCAVFDPHGKLCAQAAHIPVHLGSMAYAMADIVRRFDWQAGDMVVLNDPFLGGTHLPDVTLIAPVFVDQRLVAFVANRAHHANIGAEAPGSMPLSTTLEEEGLVIEPVMLIGQGRLQSEVAQRLCTILPPAERDGVTLPADFQAQISANRIGVQRLEGLVESRGVAAFVDGLEAMNDYARRIARQTLSEIPDGQWQSEDWLDSDGAGAEDIPVRLTLTVQHGEWHFDFTGTGAQVRGNLNCPLSVTAAAVYYALRCLLPAYMPDAQGAFDAVRITAPEGCVLNARGPAAVAAGNVETSSRVVDVVLQALAGVFPERIPACAQGTMNNVAMGGRDGANAWDYYETIAGGMGAHPRGPGLNAVHSHMTNTLNTPVESLEAHYPLRVECYGVRTGSGGEGRYPGGDGVVREYRFLAPASLTLLTERRRRGPPGLSGGESGLAGRNTLDGEPLPEKFQGQVSAGQCLRIETPGGGGWGNTRVE